MELKSRQQMQHFDLKGSSGKYTITVYKTNKQQNARYHKAYNSYSWTDNAYSVASLFFNSVFA